MMKQLDLGFLKRVYEMTLLVSLWMAGFLLIGSLFFQALSLLTGAALGTALLKFMEWSVTRVTSPSVKKQNKRSVLKWIFLKYPALAVLFYFLVRWQAFHLPVFASGLTLPYGIIFLKGIGLYLSERKTAHA